MSELEIKDLVYQTMFYKNGNSQVIGIDAKSLRAVSEILDDEDRYYSIESDYSEMVEEYELSIPQLIAINLGEYELHGRTRTDEDTVVEKHIGWMSWHDTKETADNWIRERTILSENTVVSL